MSQIVWLAGSFVDASQSRIKILLGLCVTQSGVVMGHGPNASFTIQLGVFIF
jgi:hypothetical protein